MRISRRILFLLLTTLILFLVCNGSLLTISLLLNDLDRWLNDYSNMQINEESAQTVTVNETHRVDNCGGKEVKQQLTGFGAIGYPRYEIEGTIVTGVEGQLENKYGRSSKLISIQTFSAPPGKNLEFVLTRIEKRWSGTVTFPGHFEQNKYRVTLVIEAKTTSSRDLGCVF